MEIGKRLSEARKRRNLTLRDVSRTTKIPLHFLEAIDRDDAEHMPHGLFARAFVRAYANEVGVNPKDLLCDLEPQPAEPEPNDETAHAPSGAGLFMRSLLFAVPVVAVFGAYLFGLGAARTSSEAQQAAGETPVATAGRVETVSDPFPLAISDVELQIQPRGGCIVAATADGSTIAPRTMAAGQPLVLKARGEVVLRVSDSAGCAPTVKSDTQAKPPRRARIDAVPPTTISHAEDGQVPDAPPIAEPPAAEDDPVLPPSDPPAPQSSTEQF